MKTIIAIALMTITSAAHAAQCNVETAKKYVAGIELVAADVSNGRIDTGDKVNGRTIAESDVKAISADAAYIVTVTNQKASYYNPGNFSKYIVTLKQVGNTCFPASITLVGNTSKDSK